MPLATIRCLRYYVFGFSICLSVHASQKFANMIFYELLGEFHHICNFGAFVQISADQILMSKSQFSKFFTP